MCTAVDTPKHTTGLLGADQNEQNADRRSVKQIAIRQVHQMKKVDYEHFARFRMPHTLAARGDDVFFCVRKADVEANRYRSDLWRLRGGKPAPMTSQGDVNTYALLEEGIVFPALREERDRADAKKGVPLTVLQLMPYDGGEARELLRLPYSVGSFCFISAERFFFTAQYSHAYAKALEECDGDAVKAAKRVNEDADYEVIDELPFWRNGSGFTNKTRSRLYLYDNGSVKPITDEWTDCGICRLSASGDALYYSAVTYTDSMPLYDALFRLDTVTLQSTSVSVGGQMQHSGLYPLPDGTLLAAASDCLRFGVNENPSLYVSDGDAWRLIYSGGEHCFDSSVGSDVSTGRSCAAEVMYSNGELFLLDTLDDSTQIIAVDVKTGAIRQVTRGRGKLTDAILCGDSFITVAMRGSQGGELYRVDENGSETRLTNLNTDLQTEYSYSAPSPISFVNERGDEIHGWVIPPVGFENGKKYPAILDIHGGPKTVYGDCYFHEMQLWASMGYAVIFCNPTGSDGRGDRFADIRGEYGQQDYRDIMAFTDEALRRCEFIDPARLGVTGGSYGGFMTNWIIGHTDRFRAAASQRSISNWLSFHNTSDIGSYFGRDQNGGDPWNDTELVWAQSPLKYADRAVTPTLFIHSDEDYRCPLPEGMQMFYALRAHGVPARMCIFRGENHELSRSGKPKHRIRRLREITEWFEQYLKSE